MGDTPQEEPTRGSGVSRDSIWPSRFAPWQTVSPGTLSLGINSWLTLGIVGAVGLVVWFIALTSGIMIPLIIGGVLGIMFYPLVERLAEHHIPKALGATFVVLLLAIAITATIAITVGGVVEQWPAIQNSLTDGVDSLKTELATNFGITGDAIDNFISKTEQQAASVASDASSGFASRLTSNLASSLSGALAFLFGAFLGTVILFYFLTDWPTMADWIGGHLGVPVEIGRGIVEDGTSSIRGYFQATTVTGLAVAVVIAAAMWIMGVPLAVSVGVVTFLTCYIPFFGAIISGAFAFFVTLGTNGLQSAIIVLIVVLAAQNLLQTVINNKIMGDSLGLHPITVLVSTIVGGTFAGILGSALAAPATALALRVADRMKRASADLDAEVADPEVAIEAPADA